MNILQAKLRPLDGGKILDAGTLHGAFAKTLVESFGNFESVVGVDVDEKALAIARKEITDPRFRFVREEAEKLSFADNSFDTVGICNAMHHLTDAGRALAELKRVLKPGGLFILVEMRSDQLTEPQLTHHQYHQLRVVVDNALGLSHRPTFTKEEILSFARKCGFASMDSFEQVEEKTDFKNKEELDLVAGVMDEFVDKIRGNPQFESAKTEVQKVKARLYQVGIHRPPNVVVLARK